MEFEKVIRNRKATRKFSDKTVSKQDLEKILEAARLAPSAKNIQPIKIFVIKSKEGIEAIDRVTPCRYNAPIVLAVCANKKEAFSKNDHSTYEIDASIVATHILLAATDLKIDNIWIELFDKKEFNKEFKIEENYIPVCLIPIGYKANDCPESPFHLKRKDIKDIVEYK